MKTLTRNSFLGAMMATALLMSVATMAQNKVTGGRRPAGTTTQTTNSASTVSSQAKATNSNVSTKATPSTRTTAVSSNNSQSKVASTATVNTTQRRNDNTTSGSGTTTSGRRPTGSTSAASTSGSVTRSTGATHWPSSNSVTVPSTSSSSSKTSGTAVSTRNTSSSSSSNRTNIGNSSSSSTTSSGSGTVSGGRRPTSASTNAGTISKDNGSTSTTVKPNESKNTIDSRLNNGGNNNDAANAGNISANSGIIRSGSGNTNIGGGRRPGVDNSNHNAGSSHYELTNHRNYSTYNNNYRNNDWSRPMAPPTRQYRPAVRIINRPVMPSGFVIYNRAPRINTILGLSFGSYYNASLNYLFTMGYDIDGYNRDVIYLRDVPMLRFTWADVMLSYDTYGRLYNAQFAHSTSYRDRSRFNRLYHDLYATYGTPVASHITAYEASVTWFGGSAEGYVTLEFGTDTYGRYYTMVIVGY